MTIYTVYFTPSLLSNGMLTEITHADYNDMNSKPEIFVRFPYERFSDYFIASKMLNGFKTRSELEKNWNKNKLPDRWIQDSVSMNRNRGLLQMMAILIPERFGCDFIELFSSRDIPHAVIYDFLDSLPWRITTSITNYTISLTEKCKDFLPYEEYLNRYLRIATIPDNPLNIIYLHEKLKKMSLRNRELYWTIPISNMTSDYIDNTVDDIVKWVFKISDSLVSDKQAWLAAIFLAWLLTSNHRLLRYRATLALIKILNGRSNLAAKLIGEFHDCNDPYVVERVYAAACGVALREKNTEQLRILADITYQKMFSGEYVPCHVLQRDYAQLIIERAHYLNILHEHIEPKSFVPPFRSEHCNIITEKRASELENRKGWGRIKTSIQPESSRDYGDFGRYVMDAAVHHFSEKKLGKPFRRKKGSSNYDYIFPGIKARRYILNRINQLGWKAEYFKDYEKRLASHRLSHIEESNKLERISKKYQWIGLYELLGNLSDHYWMRPEYGQYSPSSFSGTWQLGVRDFDPSQPLSDPLNNLDIEGETNSIVAENDNITWHNYPDPFGDVGLRFDREKWVSTQPNNFANLIENDSIPSHEGAWLTLSTHLNFVEDLIISHDEQKLGQLKMWVHIRCWLIKHNDYGRFLKYVDGIEFYGNGCDYSDMYYRWIGEYPWATSCSEIRNWTKESGWLRNCPIEIAEPICKINNEVIGAYPLVPGPVVFDIMKLFWDGNYYYNDEYNKLVAFCKNYTDESWPLFINREKFLKSANQSGYIPVWAALSERSCYSLKAECNIVKKWVITQQLYGYKDNRLECWHNKVYEKPLFR